MKQIDVGTVLWGKPPKKTNKRQITHAMKVFEWERAPHKCYICDGRISSFSDCHFDHKRAHANGGASTLKNVKLAHPSCNRMKGKLSLGEIRKRLGLKPKKA